jgi:hypothetical protein
MCKYYRQSLPLLLSLAPEFAAVETLRDSTEFYFVGQAANILNTAAAAPRKSAPIFRLVSQIAVDNQHPR